MILIMFTENDDEHVLEMKKLIYQCFYVDNGAVSANNSNEVIEMYKQLDNIFNPFGFMLQQYISNDKDVQSKLGLEVDNKNQKLLGTVWDIENDTLSSKPIDLDIKAKTKRQMLKSLASQYDLNNFNAPILNRCRLYIHRLQCDKDLKWDSVLNDNLLKDFPAD